MSRNARDGSITAWHLWGSSALVGVALMLLLGLTLWLAYEPLAGWNAVASYTIALAKALLVVLIFMKLARSPWLLSLAALAGLVWLGTLFAITFTDYPFRQVGERIQTIPSERSQGADARPPGWTFP
ncbi:cytochrome C oxidase subunit IV family protein [Mangrovibrevibacter kandeliae]|uniref:cytochrome C oxidase subunit IV family protein n=1 Tax=Mangrovibrevibacter kandeliae TaxID=2968473 RepID=UPI00211988D0|nr:cytochrome C oxidase subunit IV family protein [Aurantimonas sp. CSK15Z-1]MCQ8783987.1 cytochrome C oxidase subunit IV family protein [Aurantimonas sp. CSK15Z-1]